MNVVSMVREILSIANSVIGKTALPDLTPAAKDFVQRMGGSAFDELDCMLECYIRGGSRQKMNVLGHDDERVQLISTFAAVSVKSL